MQNLNDKPRVVALQFGARRRYAVPHLLHRAGYLKQVITDAHSESQFGRMSRPFRSLPSIGHRIRKLQARELVKDDLSHDLVTSYDRWVLYNAILKFTYSTNATKWLNARDRKWFSLVRPAIDFDACNMIYSMFDENLLLLEHAKKKGCSIVVDAFICPLNLRSIFESKLALGITPKRSEVAHEEFEAHYRSIFAIADCILCPSQWVAHGVRQLSADFDRKIAICPYGLSLQFSSSVRTSTPGRIFWAGRDWFRKGLHILAGAADILRTSHPHLEFRAAGITDSKITRDYRFRNIHFIGALNRKQMAQEFSCADVFVFPTKSEGMAAVVIEAMSAGCPVITTPASGVDVLQTAGAGILLDSEDPAEWANHILKAVVDRDANSAMSKNAKDQAAHYTDTAWGSRLTRTMQQAFKRSQEKGCLAAPDPR